MRETNFQTKDHKWRFHTLLKRAYDIKQCSTKISSIMEIQDNIEKYRSLKQLSENVNNLIETEKHRIQEALIQIDHLIAERKHPPPEPEVPDIETIREQTKAFINNRQPLASAPYPPLCGALPLQPDQLLSKGSFVCVLNSNNDYILGIIQSFNPETFQYLVYDADPEDNVIVEIYSLASKVIPLPTSSPARRSKATMYPIGARVLSLWHDEIVGWTSVFYTATVITQPTSSPGWYYLQFDGDPPVFADVPEKFVVQAPQEISGSEQETEYATDYN
ncbi:SAGA-associated factor 29 [Histomonas meleagridis]|uniref:SAGA-associated factor 29 n=1 Tax=Histomonas meleagridis TaxID=135588 RepID=UPI0035599016|nr:SAGA-associated factor 29 [Histomonas meleagridis]KAH0800175.1 SAGA-associated factor 29 [Histomonas meleagridis]